MNWLKKLKTVLFGSPDQEIRDPDGIYFYVRCSRCGTPVRVRADKRYDLQRDYETGGYIFRKEIMDGGCFQLIHATVHFDAAYRPIEQKIEGGEFITWETFRSLTHQNQNRQS